MEKNMIVISNEWFPKQYDSKYKYCLMVGKTDNRVNMVWNYTAREFMDIRDIDGNNVNGKYTAQQIKKMYKSGKVGFYFMEE